MSFAGCPVLQRDQGVRGTARIEATPCLGREMMRYDDNFADPHCTVTAMLTSRPLATTAEDSLCWACTAEVIPNARTNRNHKRMSLSSIDIWIDQSRKAFNAKKYRWLRQ
jgi:hypothetical protein